MVSKSRSSSEAKCVHSPWSRRKLFLGLLLWRLMLLLPMQTAESSGRRTQGTGSAARIEIRAAKVRETLDLIATKSTE